MESAGCGVWLRGLERPALSVNLGDGVSAFLAHVFSLQPTWLQEELWLRGLSGSEDDFLVNQAFSVASEIRDPQLAGLDISVG